MLFYNNNIVGFLNLILAMKINGLRNLVFSSSASVYSSAARALVSENDDKNSISPYGRTKLIIEEIRNDLIASNEDWSIVSLRYSIRWDCIRVVCSVISFK